MAEFANFGNGIGFAYLTLTDGTTILASLPNNCFTVRKFKLLAIEAAALSANSIASGNVKFTASGDGDVTAININGVDQLDANVAGNGLSVSQLATAVAAEINGFTPASGPDYTAIAIDDTVYLFATAEDGSDVNGHVVAMATDTPDNIQSTDTNIAGGSDSSKIHDEAYGFRFFLNDSDSAIEGNLAGALEITTKLVPQSLTGTVKTQSVVLVNDTITVVRQGQETHVDIDTEGAAPTDNLKTINHEGFSAGDSIYIKGKVGGRVTTINENGNIDLNGGTTFSTAGYAAVIRLQLWQKGDLDQDQWYWFEVSRSAQGVSSITDFRASDLPMISTYGAATIALGTSGDITLIVNTDKQKQILTGTRTLSGNLTITLSTSGAKAGDQFIIENNAKITVGAFTYKIAGITFTANQALYGGHLILAYYDGSAWNSWLLLNMDNSGSGTRGKIEDEDIVDASIKVASLETDLQTDQISIPISFDTNETGALKIPVYYEGTIVGIDIYVNKLIEATDDASVIIKDNGGSAMSTIVVTRNAAIGNNFNSAPSTNNTFSAGHVLTIETSKLTKGGKAFLTMKITRTSP